MPDISRRAVLAAALAIAGGMVAAACGRVGAGARPSTVDLILMTDSQLLQAAQMICQTLDGVHNSGVTVEAGVVQQGVGSLLQNMLAGQGTADVVLVTSRVRQIWNANSLMVNVGPALSSSGISARLYPALLADWSFAGRQLVVPIFRDPLVVFYNADAVAQAGVDPPAREWTLGQLVTLCTRLSAVGNQPLANATDTADLELFLELFCAFVLGFGGQLLTPNSGGGGGYVPAFADPQALDGIRALLSLHAYEPATPPSSAVEAFGRGEFALLFGHHSDLSTLQAVVGQSFAWNVAPMPTFPKRRAQPVRADGLTAVTRDPDRRSAAITVALFGATSQCQTALARLALGVPADTSLAASPLWRAGAQWLNNDVFVAHPEADVVVPQPLFFLSELGEAMTAALRGAPADQAFQTAATAAQYTLSNWPTG